MVNKYTDVLIDCESDSDYDDDFYDLIESDEEEIESKTPYHDHIKQIQKNTGVSYNFALQIAKIYKRLK